MIGALKRSLTALIILLATVSTVLLQSESYARANTITVNNLTDPPTITGNGFCTLREAIINANAGSDQTGGDCTAGSGTDTINFSLSGTITLGSTLPAIVSPHTLTIDGTGQAVTVDGADTYGFLAVNLGATVNVTAMTVTHGYTTASAGGVIYNFGTLTVSNSTFSTNSPQAAVIYNTGSLTVTKSTFSNNSGGVIYNDHGTLIVANSTFSDNPIYIGGGIEQYGGTMTVTDSTFANNTAIQYGGGIYNSDGGTVTVTRNTFSNNSAYFGGAIENEGGSMTVTDSTFVGNNASGDGGAIFNNGPTLTIVNSTFSNNTGFFGGAIDNNGGAALSVSNSTLSGNHSSIGPGGGDSIFNATGSVIVANSVLSSGSGNCAMGGLDGIGNGGYNISDDASCGFGTSTSASGKTIGDNVDPLLAVAGLQDNGGPTQTIALQSTSRAINGIPKALCPATDQRGALRPATGHTACTIGAFEYAGVIPVPILTIAPTSLGFLTVGIGTTKSLTLTMKNTAKGGTLTGNVPTLAAPFNVTAGAGPFSLGAGQVHSVIVQFTPTTPVALTTNLVITSNDPKKPSVTVKVTGTGQAGQLSVPSTLTFFSKATVPKIGTLTIRNLGLGVLHGNVGDSTGPFVVTAGGGAFTLNHLQTKVITIQFTPPAKGPFAGVLPLLSDDPKHLSFNVNLKGTGQ